MKRLLLSILFFMICLSPFAQVRVVFVNGHIGLGSPEGGKVYWQKDTSFIGVTLKALHGTVTPYYTNVQYKSLSSAANREKDGYVYAAAHLSEIIGPTVAPDTTPCNLRFRFVTHSMGAAFGEGMARCLADSGFVTDVIVHFEPYQARDISTIGKNKNVLAIDYQMADDFILRFGSGGRIKDADQIISGGRSDAPLKKKHRYPINHSSTWLELSSLIERFIQDEG